MGVRWMEERERNRKGEEEVRETGQRREDVEDEWGEG